MPAGHDTAGRVHRHIREYVICEFGECSSGMSSATADERGKVPQAIYMTYRKHMYTREYVFVGEAFTSGWCVQLRNIVSNGRRTGQSACI